jgi:two-component system, NarL family, response regulator NreC
MIDEATSSLDDPITVVLADDHPVVRRGLRVVLEEAGCEIVAEAADTGEAKRKVLGYKPDVLVLDLTMPGGSAVDAIPGMLKSSPQTAVVIVTMHDEPANVQHALHAGARAFVLKEAADSELADAVHDAIDGAMYLSPRLGARIAARPAGAGCAPDGLTDRELAVLRLIALGYTNSQIADRLYLAVRTVESHRSHLQRKIRRVSRAELVAYAREHRLIT